MIGEETIATNRAALTQKGRATQARIIDSAAGRFFERGVAGTSLDDVGAAADVGKSQLYHYFTDKAALVRAVINRQADRIVTAHESSKLDSWDGWQSWRDQIVELQRQRQGKGGCPLGSLASELADADEDARGALVTGFDRWEAVFRAGLTAMQEKGLLRSDADPTALALATLAGLQGGLLLCQTRKDVRPLEVALDTALANLHQMASERTLPRP